MNASMLALTFVSACIAGYHATLSSDLIQPFAQVGDPGITCAAEEAHAVSLLQTRAMMITPKKLNGRDDVDAGQSEINELERRVCGKVAYIRIQKTGSTTLAEYIMPAMFQQYHQHGATRGHAEFNEAFHVASDCMVTMLRDPVERFISEWKMVRSGSGLIYQDQWDVHDEDLDWLTNIAKKSPEDDAMLEYLEYPRNPSRNRQALYLLGFDRVSCGNEVRGKFHRKNVHCKDSKPFGYPAHAYDWDTDHDVLLARAKEHLSSLRAFGITDCYSDSMKVIAKEVGWDADAASEMSADIHARDPSQELSGTTAKSDEVAAEFVKLRAQIHHASATSSHLKEQVARLGASVKKRIREVNSIDVQLVAYARQVMLEKYGVRCAQVHAPMFSSPHHLAKQGSGSKQFVPPSGETVHHTESNGHPTLE